MGTGSRGNVIIFYPFILLFLSLTFTCPSLSSYAAPSKNQSHLCLPSQRDALLRFRNAFNITVWDEHVDCCQWNGIVCDSKSGDVVEVHAYKFDLTRDINYITHLSPLCNLQVLDFFGTHLHGVVPLELSRFSKLHSLDLTLNDELTMESHSLRLLIQNLTKLESFRLDGVKIRGDPFNALVNISNALAHLSLSDCDLHGVLPESIFHLPNLLHLDLSGNIGLMVSLPTSNWSSPLEWLDLSPTNFSGNLPNSIGNLKNLTFLNISSPHLSSPLPSSIENLTRLTDLFLSSFAHREAFPTSICRLSSLMFLVLPHNKFTGVLPQCLGNLTGLLHLDLSYNQLTGLPPPSSINITRLESLVVNSNRISDTVIHWLQFFPNLNYIDLGENNFHGEIPLSICKINPSFVDLSNNKLIGNIPPCMIMNRLGYVLNLRMNKLEGTIPNRFPQDCRMEVLDLSENRLNGPLPQSMRNWSSLVALNLANNNIEDFFPNWLETLSMLQVLVLRCNKLNGEVKTIPSHHPFPKLSIFDISNNNFTGLLPVGYISQFDAMKDVTTNCSLSSMYTEVQIYSVFVLESLATITMTLTIKGSTLSLPKVLKALKLIDFSNNNFHGEIPKSIGSLIALKGLNLSHNNLTGSLPPSIQNMTGLEWLDLSSNRLTGQIPYGLAQLSGLESLNLAHNKLRGMIPIGKQFDTFGKDSFIGNAGLCGSQIAIACDTTPSSQQPSLPHIQEGDFDIFDWKIILMGYGCGLVIGLSIGIYCF